MSDDNGVFVAPKAGVDGLWDVVIIGSGPAGLTAAIYTTRGAASTLLLAGDNWGGQLMLTTTVDNYPGYPDGIEGPDLMVKMRAQAERFGAEFVEADATTIDIKKTPFEIISGEKTYKAKTIIIATGAITRWLGVPGEEKLRGRGVSSCAPCDAPFFKDKKVMVVGGGDSAMEEALVLSKYATKVTIVHRRGEFRASQAMQDKIFAKEKEGKINIIWNTEVKEIIGQERVEKIRLINSKDKKETEIEVDGVFVAVGHAPASDIFKGGIKMDEKGYILTGNKYPSATDVAGVFVAGDVHDYIYKQAITAAGFGCMAAMDVLKYLDQIASN